MNEQINDIPQVASVASNLEQPKKPTNLKFLLIIFGIVGVVFLIILGSVITYTLISNSKNLSQNITITPSPTLIQNSNVTNSIDNTYYEDTNQVFYQSIGNKNIKLSFDTETTGYPFVLELIIAGKQQPILENRCYFAVMAEEGNLLATQCKDGEDFRTTIWEFDSTLQTFKNIKDLKISNDSFVLPGNAVWQGSNLALSLISEKGTPIKGSGIMIYQAEFNSEVVFETCYGEYGASMAVAAKPVFSADAQFVAAQCDGNQKIVIYNLEGKTINTINTNLAIIGTEAQEDNVNWSQLLTYIWDSNSKLKYKFPNDPDSKYITVNTGL